MEGKGELDVGERESTAGVDIVRDKKEMREASLFLSFSLSTTIMVITTVTITTTATATTTTTAISTITATGCSCYF